MGQQVNVYDKLVMKPGAIVEGSWNGSFDRGGTTYYVNNITGSSTADGLSWNSACDQVSTAITLSEASRLVHPGTTTNDYIMNTIVVQGTGTAYSAISALPSYARIIGLGGTPRGNGTGIATIDGAGAADAIAGTARGMELYNIQAKQSSAASYYGLDLATCFRSRIIGCGFVNNGSGGIRVVQGGSIVMDDVFCGHDTYAQAYGLEVAGGANFNSCKITNSDFAGDTAGVLISNTSAKETVLFNCAAYGGTYGFQDTLASGQAAAYHGARYVCCYGYGDSSTSINDGGFKITYEYTLKAIGCIGNDNGTLHNYPTVTD